MSIEVLESFGPQQQPPAWLRPTVERMLASIPEKYIVGLRSVILTNHDAMNRAHRRKKVFRRGRKFAIKHAAGLYRQEWQGKPASIEIFVEEILPKGLVARRVQLFRELLIGLTLFHEVGHHIHYTARPEYAEKEDVADKWGYRLIGNYLRRSRPTVYWMVWPVSRVLRLLRKRRNRK